MDVFRKLDWNALQVLVPFAITYLHRFRFSTVFVTPVCFRLVCVVDRHINTYVSFLMLELFWIRNPGLAYEWGDGWIGCRVVLSCLLDRKGKENSDFKSPLPGAHIQLKNYGCKSKQKTGAPKVVCCQQYQLCDIGDMKKYVLCNLVFYYPIPIHHIYILTNFFTSKSHWSLY